MKLDGYNERNEYDRCDGLMRFSTKLKISVKQIHLL